MTDRLEALGCDPIEGMARIATDEAADIKHPGTDVQGTRGYVAPKRKASEIKADVGLSLIDVLKEVNARKEERRRSWRR